MPALGKKKSETDRQSCMSWLVSCSFIGMQISCIQEHLGVLVFFFAASFPLSALLHLPFHVPLFIHQTPLPLLLLRAFFSHPFHAFSIFSSFHFFLPNLLRPPFVSRLHLLSLFPDAHAPSSDLLLCLLSCPLLHLRLPQSIWLDAFFIPLYLVYSRDNEEICEVSQCGSVVRGRI